EAVVVGRDGVARVDAGVDPDPEAAGRMVRLDAPRRRPEGDRVLRIDAALDGMAVELDVALFGPQFAAGGDPYLLLDEVGAGDHLGDRMLDLEAGVHLDEVELAVLVQELDGSGSGELQLRHRRG